MENEATGELACITRFLSELAKTGKVKHAARASGSRHQTFYRWRKRDPRFAAAWADSLAAFEAARSAALSPPVIAKLGKRAGFLEALAETSSVTASAERSGLPLREAYKLRRKDAGFAAQWRAALLEGYDMLEIELLGYLRDPQPTRRMDVASALRLLAAHRETVVRERALREDEDEEAVLASIDRFIDEMRARREANAALLIEHGPGSDQSGSDQQGSDGDAAG